MARTGRRRGAARTHLSDRIVAWTYPVHRSIAVASEILYGAIALVALVAMTLGLRGLKPAAPRVDRASIWIDSVQKGPLVIEVRGSRDAGA